MFCVVHVAIKTVFICHIYTYIHICMRTQTQTHTCTHQGVNQKITNWESERSEHGRVSMPKCSWGILGGGTLSPPFLPAGSLGGWAPWKKLNCVQIDLNWVQTTEINTFENCKISTNWKIITFSIFLIT